MWTSEMTQSGSWRNTSHSRCFPRSLPKQSRSLGAASALLSLLLLLPPSAAPATRCSHQLGLHLARLLLASTGRESGALSEGDAQVGWQLRRRHQDKLAPGVGAEKSCRAAQRPVCNMAHARSFQRMETTGPE